MVAVMGVGVGATPMMEKVNERTGPPACALPLHRQLVPEPDGEGWARYLLGDRVDACSAGTDPHGLNPLAVRAMSEAGVDISSHTSKPVEACSPESLDLVVTVCDHAHENCPMFITQSPRTHVVHHGFGDPPKLTAGAASDGEAMPHYRRIRDEIRSFIERLPAVLERRMATQQHPRRSEVMTRIEVFDPPMCCSTGVCGPDPDDQLAKFSADLDWLTHRGVEVRRYNLMQEPAAFTANEHVKRIVDATDGDGLPVVVIDGRVVSQQAYPTRERLAELAGLAGHAATDTVQPAAGESMPIFDERIAELVAIGAAIAANCEPCLEYHHHKAAELGIAEEDMIQAVNVAQRVKEQPAKIMVQLAQRLLIPQAAAAGGGCCGQSSSGGCC